MPKNSSLEPSAVPSSATRKAKNLRGYAFEIVMVCLVVGAIFAFQQRNMLPSDGSVMLPDTQFVTLSSNTRMLLANDKPTLVYIFAPWCTKVQKYTPTLAYHWLITFEYYYLTSQIVYQVALQNHHWVTYCVVERQISRLPPGIPSQSRTHNHASFWLFWLLMKARQKAREKSFLAY